MKYSGALVVIKCFRKSLFLLFMILMLLSTHSMAAPVALVTPSIYDNAEEGVVYGQTFTAESTSILGVKWYIGDPTRPGDTSVNPLEGSADIVLYELVGDTPLELARAAHQDSNGTTAGLSTFSFPAPVAITIGLSYFIGIDAQDGYGIGLGDQDNSSYEGGFQGRIRNGVLESAGAGSLRDTSFEILLCDSPAAVPTNGVYALIFAIVGVVVVACRFRRKSILN